MTSTEQRYAQIEKEALATTWACEKFADFVLGKEFDPYRNGPQAVGAVTRI